MLSDTDLRKLLDHLDRPWAGFRKVRKGVKKRLHRHMLAIPCRSIEAYLAKIDKDPLLRAECENRLTVTISRFFRDRLLWDQLTRHILPELALRFNGRLSAWSAGCANGEEPYSLAMVWQTVADTLTDAGTLRIVATDANAPCLARAKVGRYPQSSLKEVPETYRRRWFQKVAGKAQWKIAAELENRILWQAHQLLDPPPEGIFHLILLRNNLLTYYQGDKMQAAFQRIAARLAKGGILIVGAHEHPPLGQQPLQRDKSCPLVFRLPEHSLLG